MPISDLLIIFSVDLCCHNMVLGALLLYILSFSLQLILENQVCEPPAVPLGGYQEGRDRDS